MYILECIRTQTEFIKSKTGDFRRNHIHIHTTHTFACTNKYEQANTNVMYDLRK